MDQDDSEKRVAELEGRLTEARNTSDPGANPTLPRKIGFGRPAQSGSQLRRLGKRLGAIAAVAAAVVFFGLAAYDFCAYLVGTPATATTQHCVDSTDSTVSCTGKWTVGGNSYSGPIVGDLGNRYDISGKSLDVRVHGDSAYRPDSGLPKVYFGLFALIIALAFDGRRVRDLWRGLTRRHFGGRPSNR
jgi:hypothetical protein